MKKKLQRRRVGKEKPILLSLQVRVCLGASSNLKVEQNESLIGLLKLLVATNCCASVIMHNTTS